MIMEMTVATHKMIASLKRRNAYWIIVVDEEHEGPSYVIDDVTYCSREESLEIRKDYPDVIYHFFRNPFLPIDVRGFDFR